MTRTDYILPPAHAARVSTIPPSYAPDAARMLEAERTALCFLRLADRSAERPVANVATSRGSQRPTVRA